MGFCDEAANMRPEYDAFISYARSDREDAEKLANLLKATGLRVSFDVWDYVLGENWFTRTSQAVEKAAAVLILIGPKGFRPSWVNHEISVMGDIHVRRWDYRIIPVLLPGAANRTAPGWRPIRKPHGHRGLHIDCVQLPDQPTEWRPRIPRQAAPFMDWASCAQRAPPAARTCFSSSVQLITARKRPPRVPRRSMMNRPSRVTS